MYADNYALSRARAEVVAKYLVERLKIDPSRVTIEGHGADEPLAAGHDPASLALNRRVDIAIEGSAHPRRGQSQREDRCRRGAGRNDRHAGVDYACGRTAREARAARAR